jgi:protease-3
MSVDEFEKNKTALIQSLTEEPKNLNHEMSRYKMQISEQYYQFDISEVTASCVKLITMEELIEFYERMILSSERRKLSVHLKSAKAPIYEGTDLVELDKIEGKSVILHGLDQMIEAKAGLELGPYPFNP